MPTPALLIYLRSSSRRHPYAPYIYTLAHRSRDLNRPGCIAVWHVTGGRGRYQITIERTETGALSYQCDCADHVYRSRDMPHECKHLAGMRNLLKIAAMGSETLSRVISARRSQQESSHE